MAKIVPLNEKPKEIGLSFRRERDAMGEMSVFPVTEDEIPIADVLSCEVTSKMESLTVMTLSVYVSKTTAEKAAERLLKTKGPT
jgi:hypothetical protein